jgi:hypothetical protein
VPFKGCSASLYFSDCHFSLFAAPHLICNNAYTYIHRLPSSSHFIEGDKIKGRRFYAEIMRIRSSRGGKKQLGDESREREHWSTRKKEKKIWSHAARIANEPAV